MALCIIEVIRTKAFWDGKLKRGNRGVGAVLSTSATPGPMLTDLSHEDDRRSGVKPFRSSVEKPEDRGRWSDNILDCHS